MKLFSKMREFKRPKIRLNLTSRRKLLPAFCGVIFASVLALVAHITSIVFAAPTEPIESITLTSQHTNYTSNTPGSWNIDKSAHWTGNSTAQVRFDVDTVAKMPSGYTDILFVVDVSGSMSGEKIEQVKSDATELTNSVLSNSNNRIAMVSFETSAKIETGFTNSKSTVLSKIENLNAYGSTNYYDGFKKAEDVLTGYVKQSNRQLIMMFLTDGYPNMDTTNEITEYEYLKTTYPYITINAIQYEMGEDILDPIKNISDDQYIADMSTLNNVLFEASVAPYIYDSFVITDYIDDTYFTIDSVDRIKTSIGSVSLTYEGSTPVITWTIDGLRSGASASMTIDLNLKSIYQHTGGLYPTNKRETVSSELESTPNESVVSTNTPVLKNNYNVTYDANSPNDCMVIGMPSPNIEEHFVYETVAISSTTPTCSGYNFAGYAIATNKVTKVNDDYFIMPEQNVIIRATWTKVSIAKSMDGTIHETKVATFNRGTTVNARMKQLSGPANTSYSQDDNSITAIKRADLLSDTVDTDDSRYILSANNSAAPIYAWFDDTDGTLYYYTDAEVITLDKDSKFFFNKLTSLTDISGIADWDTSKVTDMSYMFRGINSLTNIDALSNWDTSSVTNMEQMFLDASSLTDVDALSGWDMSNVTTIGNMFRNASSLTDIDALASWDTSKVTNMSYTFYGLSSLTDIDALASWDTSNVKYMDHMFCYASSLSDIDALANWNTSNVTNMSAMFSYATSLSNIDGASGWDTSKVTNMYQMFGKGITGFIRDDEEKANLLENIDALSNWDTSSVTNMGLMFEYSSITNIDGASGWDTSKVTNMGYMFGGAYDLTNIDGASGWDTSSVTYMDCMFCNATSLTNIDGASGWDTSKVTNMVSVFRNANSLTNIDGASGWDTSSVTVMADMFYLTQIANIDALANWNTSNVTNMSYMFFGANSLTNIDGATNWNTSNVTNLLRTFEDTKITNVDALASWDTSNVTNMEYLFYRISTLTDIDGLSSWDVSSVTSMQYMFYATQLANTNALANWTTSNVANMSHMFNGINTLTNVDGLSSWDTSNVTNMSSMFRASSSLTDIGALANWTTSNVTDMNYMFCNADSLTNINALANWNTSSVTNMSGMFYGAEALTNINGATNWNTSNVTTMEYMFRYDSAITDLSPLENWDISSLTNKTRMFENIPDTVPRPSWY